MAEVFLFYSRKDSGFIRTLYERLTPLNRDVWVDWRDIPPTAEWLKEVFSAIDGANALVFVISPDSVVSEVCRQELDHAVQHHKRLLPVVYRDIDPKTVPQALASLEWIFFRERDDVDGALQSLINAIDTDLDWVQAHTCLLVRAIEWDNKGRENSFLLRGRDLKEAEQWLMESGSKEPQPTPLQAEYIASSRKSAVAHRRMMLGSVTFALVVALVLAVAAWNQRARAELGRRVALARRIVDEAEVARGQQGGLERSILLAVEAMRDHRSAAADLAVRRGLAESPRNVAQFNVGTEAYTEEVVGSTPASPTRETMIAKRLLTNLPAQSAVLLLFSAVESCPWNLVVRVLAAFLCIPGSNM